MAEQPVEAGAERMREMGLHVARPPGEFIDVLYQTASLHDIGKVACRMIQEGDGTHVNRDVVTAIRAMEGWFVRIRREVQAG